MPKANEDRERVSLWVARSGNEAVKTEAARRGISASDLYREVFRLGWTEYQKTIRKGTK